MKRFLVGVFVTVFVCSIGYAAEFEGNRWGKSKSEIAAELNARDKLFKFTSFGEVKYNDTMFGYPCEVLMSFDEEYGLYSMWLAATGNVLQIADLENKVLTVLTAKYGQASEVTDKNVAAFSTVTYKWFEESGNTKYSDVKVHVAKKTDGTGSLFIEYSNAGYLIQRDKKRAGII